MKKSAVFDLDGTLLNTLDDLAAAANHVLKTRGLPVHPAEAYKRFVGNGVPKLVERMVPEALRSDAGLLAGLKAEFDAYYGAHGQDMTRPYDGIVSMLDGLCGRGVRLAVLSNKPHEFVRVLVPHYFGDRFAAVCGQRPGFPAKPDGTLVRELLGQLGVCAADTVYIGDSGVDMQTAVNGGVFGVGVLWGFREREELLENGARALISHPRELAEYL